MVLSAVVVSLTVREPSREEVLRRDAEEAAREQRPAGNAAQTEAMPAPVRRSLGFLLLSIALWFIGYNAVETWFTTYASQVWGMALGESSVCLTIAMAGAIASYVPVGALAGRIGRKNTILLGTALLTASFFCAFLSTLAFAQFSPVMYVLFVMVGIAWAAISVNSLPMVVEMCGRETWAVSPAIITPSLWRPRPSPPSPPDGCCAMWAMTPSFPMPPSSRPAAC